MSNYIFDQKSSDKTKKFWQCKLKNECMARIHTNMDNTSVVKTINNHSHGSDPKKIAVGIIRANILEQALQTIEIPSVIFNQAIQGIATAIHGKMPTKDSIRKMVQDIRKENRLAPPTPVDQASVVIPEEYQTYQIMGLATRIAF
ncbi:hypothetical protein MXB_442 [Myxobolus squamalis]|nr:hypothetical protein MXB_442 [Myxobolus squamalis]